MYGGTFCLSLTSIKKRARVVDMCTCIKVKAKDLSVVIGRTMEFGIDPGSAVTVFPRNLPFTGIGPENKPGLSWTGKYGFVGMSVLDMPLVSDGMNEKGLYVGELYLPGFTKYQDVALGSESKSISQLDVAVYLLSLCSTVDEAKKAIENVSVFGLYKEEIKGVPPLHYAIHDQTGNSAVFEYADGKLQIYDNPLGVLTNSPTFDWHQINLRNFINLSATTVPQLQLNGEKITQLGQGTGMLGLPGDSTPPSRFIRATAFTQTVLEPENAEKAVNLTYHIMNNFDIPLGFSRAEEHGQVMYDFTFWTTLSDLKNKEYYYRGYKNIKTFKVSLNDLDLSGTEVKKLDTSSEDWYQKLS